MQNTTIRDKNQKNYSPTKMSQKNKSYFFEIHDHPFIQKVIQTEGKLPSVILYMEDSLP